MAIGISEPFFWTLNPKRLEPYIEAERLKLKHENYIAWLNGWYIHEAVSVAIYNAARKKGARAESYLSEPRQVVAPTESEREAKAEAERQKAIAFFSQMERNFKRKEAVKLDNR